MSSKGSSLSVDMCSLPEVVQFSYHEEQEMHSTITITNSAEHSVSYKIKTNKPGLYLVKPMEGQIYTHGTATISFKRKQLTAQNFAMLLSNPAQNKEKFLVEFVAEVENNVGIMQKHTQVSFLGVTFVKGKGEEKSPEVKVEWPKPHQGSNKKDVAHEVSVDLVRLLLEKKSELESLQRNRQRLQTQRASSEGSRGIFTISDLIRVMVFSFLMGVAIF